MNRLWFLQAARGIACLLIVFIHWIGVVCSPNIIAPYIYQIPISNYVSPELPLFIMDMRSKIVPFDFREVYFGLGLFFLISGFVIPLSMRKGTQTEFLIKRLLRIYPVVIAATLITSIILFISQKYYGIGSFSSEEWIKTTLSNMFIVRDYLGYQFVDNSIWTLEVEIHFYLICFFIGFFSLYKKAKCLLLTTLLFCITAKFPDISKIVKICAANSPFITLMLMGTTLFNYKQNGWSIKKTILTILFLFLANKFCVDHTYTGDVADFMFSNHVYVFAFFVILMMAGEKLPYSKTLDSLANVSYPLYLVHGFTAYSIFFAITKLSHSPFLGILSATIVTVFLTYVMHIYVENKCIEYSKLLFTKRRNKTNEGVNLPIDAEIYLNTSAAKVLYKGD